MFTLKAENMYSEVLELTHNPQYSVLKIDGLDPPNATINTSTISTADGTRFNSSRVNERNLVITVALNGDVSRGRIELYKHFKMKHPVKIYFKNSMRNVCIEGYTEDLNCDPFEQGVQAQISILCPQPYFRSINELVKEFSSTEPLFEFPFAIEKPGIEFSRMTILAKENIINQGDAETGVVIELFAQGTVINPVIYNLTTRETLELKVTMQTADLIRINTISGEKSVVLQRDGVNSNVVNALDKTSHWIHVQSGDNVFTYECESGLEFLQLKILHTDKFEGV